MLPLRPTKLLVFLALALALVVLLLTIAASVLEESLKYVNSVLIAAAAGIRSG